MHFHPLKFYEEKNPNETNWTEPKYKFDQKASPLTNFERKLFRI